jgi:hypothetical protein
LRFLLRAVIIVFTEIIIKGGNVETSVTTATKRSIVEVIYNGQPRELPYQPHESVSAALAQSLDLFGITTNRHLMTLFNEAGQEITNEEQSMEAAGVKPGDKLLLGQSRVKGG